MEGTETLCPHATILNHRWLPGTLSRLLSGKPDEWMHLSPFYTRMHGEGLRYANSTSQYSLAFSLYRDDWGFQVNPLCRHDITSPFPPSGNEGYVRNRDVPFTFWNKVQLRRNHQILIQVYSLRFVVCAELEEIREWHCHLKWINEMLSAFSTLIWV